LDNSRPVLPPLESKYATLTQTQTLTLSCLHRKHIVSESVEDGSVTARVTVRTVRVPLAENVNEKVTEEVTEAVREEIAEKETEEGTEKVTEEDLDDSTLVYIPKRKPKQKKKPKPKLKPKPNLKPKLKPKSKQKVDPEPKTNSKPDSTSNKRTAKLKSARIQKRISRTVHANGGICNCCSFNDEQPTAQAFPRNPMRLLRESVLATPIDPQIDRLYTWR